MADRTAKRNVWVGKKLYLAGDSVPKEDADLVTNDKVWTEPEEAPAPADASSKK